MGRIRMSFMQKKVEFKTVEELIEALEPIISACNTRAEKLEKLGDRSGSQAWSIISRSLQDLIDHAERRRDRLEGR